jgi:long-subunit fatty acid transport protein
VLSLAGYYEPRLSLAARRYKRVHGVINDTTRFYDVSLPQSFSMAAAVNLTNRVGFDIGLTLYPWQEATITRSDVESPLGFKNVWRGSIGAEYNLDSLHPVRVGYSQQTWYYGTPSDQFMPPTAIKENGIHFGTSVPVPKFGSLDISGELLFRNSYTIKETAGRLMLTLSYSEAWAKRTRRWGY